jgi:hypothetical protein
MNGVTISKAKLLDKGMEVDFAQKKQHGTGKVGEEYDAEVHDDLRKAFNALSPHLASLCDQFDKDGTLTKAIDIRGFSAVRFDTVTSFLLVLSARRASGSISLSDRPFNAQRANPKAPVYSPIGLRHCRGSNPLLINASIDLPAIGSVPLQAFHLLVRLAPDCPEYGSTRRMKKRGYC